MNTDTRPNEVHPPCPKCWTQSTWILTVVGHFYNGRVEWWHEYDCPCCNHRFMISGTEFNFIRQQATGEAETPTTVLRREATDWTLVPHPDDAIHMKMSWARTVTIVESFIGEQPSTEE